jgi:alkylation response protein AidB-like acyl-CoA dehydrogenase
MDRETAEGVGMRDAILEPEHRDFRRTVRAFVAREVVPHYAEWEEAGQVDREVWRKAGAAGLLGLDTAVEHGGGGETDYRFSALITEELARVGAGGLGVPLHNDIIGPYLNHLATGEQRARWLPGFCAGELVTALAITEPDAGSDLGGLRTRAVFEGCHGGDGGGREAGNGEGGDEPGRDGHGDDGHLDDGQVGAGHYVLDGAKAFVSNGIQADLIIVAAVTDPAARARGRGGLSLLVVERGMSGVTRSGPLRKLGLHAQDTAELAFDGVRVPAANLLGRAGRGLAEINRHLPRERVSIAVAALAEAEAVFAETLAYCKTRQAFGKPLGDLQHVRFELAEMATELDVAREYLDRRVLDHVAGRLDAASAARVKWWTTDVLRRVVDRCLQLHGGYGFMREYRVARAYTDTRMMPIYGGSNEIMKEIVGRSLGL